VATATTNYTAKKAIREIMLNNSMPLPAKVKPTFPVFKPMATLITPITSNPNPVHKAHTEWCLFGLINGEIGGFKGVGSGPMGISGVNGGFRGVGAGGLGLGGLRGVKGGNNGEGDGGAGLGGTSGVKGGKRGVGDGGIGTNGVNGG